MNLHQGLRAWNFHAAGHTLRLTCSIGLAWAHQGDNWESLVGRADDALYKAKAAGRDRVVESGRLMDGVRGIPAERQFGATGP